VKWILLLVLMIGGCTTELDASDPVTSPTIQPVYPAKMSQITFSHIKHAEMACEGCHTEAPKSRLSSDVLTPSMNVCAECHTHQEPLISECSSCHLGLPPGHSAPIKTAEDWRAVKPAPFVLPRAQANLRFAHERHTSMSCETCHQGRASEPTLPSMDSCMSCHSPSADAAMPCASCHTTAVQGMSATRLNPGLRVSLKPENHDLDWVARHGKIAMAMGNDCVSCHQEQDCASCHNAQMASPFSVHPPGFNVMHSVDARSNLTNCTSCHTVDGFCAECHTRSLVTTRPPGAPPRLAFHPPGWVDSAGGHGMMARRNINDCASCHVENDCVSCHTGINPHPPEFRFQCKSLAVANPTSCAKCHLDLPRALTQCL